MTGLPRLKLISARDPLDIVYGSLMRNAQGEIGFWLSLASLGWLSYRAWLGQKHSGEKNNTGKPPPTQGLNNKGSENSE